MALNRDKIKQKINQFEKKAPREKIDYTKYFWKPTPGKYIIRIVPSAFQEDGDSFIEKFFHYKLNVKFPVIAVPGDAIYKTADYLKKSELEHERRLGYQLTPRMRVFIPIIVRGEEDKGVRYYQFGKGLYEKLLAIADDEDYGDFTDIVSGRDFTVNVKLATMENNVTYNEAEFICKPNPTPLSKNPAEVEEWLSVQPNLDDLYTPLDDAELRKLLDKVVNSQIDSAQPEEEEEETEEDEASEEKVDEKPAAKAPVSTPKKSSKRNYDDLF